MGLLRNAIISLALTCLVQVTRAQEVYTAREHEYINFNDCNAEWSRCANRSRQSEHFILYWQTGFGSDPMSTSIPAELRFDPDSLLVTAEELFALNVGLLNFATLGDSELDNWKLSIFLYYQTEWKAYGAGYDNVVGALWLSPNTVQPAGYTIAHEIGHSFQYQVWVDHRGGSGFRYGFGPNGEGGNGYWEGTGNWQANKRYPNEIFNYNFDVYKAECHRHLHHERYRYQSLFFNYYWTEKHGEGFIGTLWRSTQEYEDAPETYMRITGISLDEFWAELYDMCSKFATWDLDELRDLGKARIGQIEWKETELGPQSFRVHYDKAPETTGYNVIRINVPPGGTGNTEGASAGASCLGFPSKQGWVPDAECCDKYQCGANEGECDLDSQCAGDLVCGGPGSCTDAWGTDSEHYPTYRTWNCCVDPNGNTPPTTAPSANRVVSTVFKGIPNAAGFNSVDASRANWRYGYVALLDDAKTRVYSPMYQGSSNTVDFAVPDGCTTACSLFFVVVGAPNTYNRHQWDDDITNDPQWPYEVSFTNTNLFGRATPGVEPQSIEFSYEVTIGQSTGFDGPRVQLSDLDKTALANTFGISITEITDGIGTGAIQFVAVENDNGLESQTTANGYGHWFDANGDVTNFGPDARAFSEFDRWAFWFTIGQYPGQVFDGDSFRIRQGLVYTYDGTSTVQATFTFNIRITPSGSGNSTSTSTTAAVVGAGVAGLGLLGGVSVALRRRRRKKSAEAMDYSTHAEMPKVNAPSSAKSAGTYY